MKWGASFWKTNAHAPFPIWLWLNGHEWAKRPVGFRLDFLNGFLPEAEPTPDERKCNSPNLLTVLMGVTSAQPHVQTWLLGTVTNSGT
jgi:hypothetical protein